MNAKIFFVVTIVILFLPFSLQAQQTYVRSGAHDGFSRLVFRRPTGSDWRATELNGGFRIELSNFSNGFDVNDVFNFIDKSYIASVDSNERSIDVIFSCDCQYRIFETESSYIVLDVFKKIDEDVIEGNFDTLSAFLLHSNRKLMLPRPRVDTNASGVSAEESLMTSEGRLLHTTGNSNRMQTNVENADERFSISRRWRGELKHSESQMEFARIELLEHMAQAVKYGALSKFTAGSVVSSDYYSSQIDVSAFNQATSEYESTMEEPVPHNFSIEGGYNILYPESLNPPAIGSAPNKCKAYDVVSFLEDGVASINAGEIATYRSNLFSDMGRVNYDIAKKLIEHYLFNGFGAEALEIINIDSVLMLEHSLLSEIAEIMEYGEARSSNELENFLGCSSKLELWAIIAKSDLDFSAEIDVNAALRSLTALPLHLRKFIAPKLSLKLMSRGDTEGAELALRSLERAQIQNSAYTELAKAEIQISSGEKAEARQRLSEVITSNEQQSAKALINFVDLNLEVDSYIDESVATLVEAYAMEMRGDPLGADLKKTHVLALAKSGQFDSAFEVLSRMRFSENYVAKQKLLSSLMEIVTDTAPDVIFLERIFDFYESGERFSEARQALSVSERLLDLGFASVAEAVFKQADPLPETTIAKELWARIALALSRPSEAEASVKGIETQAALRLMADALSANEMYNDASQIFHNIGQNEESSRAAWLAEDWEQVSKRGGAKFSNMAKLVQENVDDSGQIEGMLGRLSSIISNSAAARVAIENLLTQ